MRKIKNKSYGVIIGAVSCIAGLMSGAFIKGSELKKSVLKEHAMSEKHLAMFLLMNQWVKNTQEQKKVEDYFIRNNIKKIAIYGMSYMGETLFHELSDSSVEISYCIDNSMQGMYQGKQIFSKSDPLGEVDAIVVTAITNYEDIKMDLEKNYNYKMLSLEEIIYDL